MLQQSRSASGILVNPHEVYLITYSQANRILFLTRESFGHDVVEELNHRPSKIKVLLWACCLEGHQNGGDHYHVSVKISDSKGWKSVKEFLMKKSGIVVNSADSRQSYYTALKYISKRDTTIFLSPNHPSLSGLNSRKTLKYISAIRKKTCSIFSFSKQPCRSRRWNKN